MEFLYELGEIISEKYRIIGTLGQGGVGVTYAALDLETHQQVALKVLSLRRMTDWKKIELFEREARILSQLNHSGIPHYLDYFQIDTPADRNFYIVQQLAPGKSLDALVENGWQPNEEQVKNIACQVLEILVYLQSLMPAVIHRDIKPQNIILQEDGKVFLVDFGAVQDTYHHTVTGGSTVVGTYGYMAPEQFRGQAVLSTDLYGLGTTLLFLLTKQIPADLPRRKLKIDFRDRVSIYTEFADWIEKAIEPVIEDRFHSAKDALAALRGEQIFITNIDKMFKRSPQGRISLINTNKRLFLETKFTHLGKRKGIYKLITPLYMLLPFAGLAPILFILLELFMRNLFNYANSSRILICSFDYFCMMQLVLNIPLAIGTTSALFIVSLSDFLFSATSRLRIEIDKDNFCIERWLLGLCYQKVRERTANIERIKLQKLGLKHLTACVVRSKQRQYRFGLFLSQKEKQWLVEELNNFLFISNPQSS